MVPLSFAGREFIATREGALFCTVTRSLLVADLHLEKSSWYAALGQLLPPYDSLATLTALTALIDRFAPDALWCLGDSFHDSEGPSRLGAASRAALGAIARRTRLTWITGNHDERLEQSLGGIVVAAGEIAGVRLRHIADPSAPPPEISGHFHPKLKVTARGRCVSRACFVRGRERMVLPAFGCLTGGMHAFDPAIAGILGGPVSALVVADGRLLDFPNAVTETAC